MFNFHLFMIGVVTASMVLVGQSLPIQNNTASHEQSVDGGRDIDQQQEYACLLEKNVTAKCDFEYSIRVKHGITDRNYNDVFVAKTATSIDQDIRCRSLGRRGCRNGNVTWCVDVYHPMENIEACFSEGLLINATEAALGLDLPGYFEVSARGGLRAKKLPLHFSNSYLTCSVHDESQNCTKKTFTSLGVSFESSVGVKPIINIRSIGREASESNVGALFIGETNVFYCTAEYNHSTNPPYRYQGRWQIDGDDMNNVINEDPFCNPAENQDCSEDPLNGNLKENRIRFYQLLQTTAECPIPTYVISNWMVIDEATEQDASHDYSCSANYVSFPSPRTIGASVDYHLKAVNPED